MEANLGHRTLECFIYSNGSMKRSESKVVVDRMDRKKKLKWQWIVHVVIKSYNR